MGELANNGYIESAKFAPFAHAANDEVGGYHLQHKLVTADCCSKTLKMQCGEHKKSRKSCCVGGSTHLTQSPVASRPTHTPPSLSPHTTHPPNMHMHVTLLM